MPSRNRSLLEQAQQSNVAGTNQQVRNELEVYSTTEVDNLITTIDLSPYATNATVASISGSLENSIEVLSTNVDGISGDLADLDLSFTAKIQQDCMQSAAVTGSETTVIGSLTITIDGVEYKLARVN
jgi:hypothetical protein